MNERRRRAPIPESVGRYDILLPIASGGAAVVFLAIAQGVGGFKRQVALKLTHEHLMHEPSFSEALLEEAKLAANIRHPNVVQVLDVGVDPNGIFLVMDYVEGDTLSGIRKAHSKHVRNRAMNADPDLDANGSDAASCGEGPTARTERFPTRIGMRILVDALAGLHAAHSLCDSKGKPLGLVHRDFSPQNILVSLDGVAQLADFGLAKAESRIGNTAVGTIKGKLTYLAPEQAQCKGLDCRSDVWAAGVVAWEIVTNSRLYRNRDEVGTLLKIISETPPLLRTINPSFDRTLEEVIASALTIDRHKRCPDAATLRRGLIDACQAIDGLADSDEVALFVERMIGDKLKERRSRVTKLLQIRAQVGRLADESWITTGVHRLPPTFRDSVPRESNDPAVPTARRFMPQGSGRARVETASMPVAPLANAAPVVGANVLDVVARIAELNAKVRAHPTTNEVDDTIDDREASPRIARHSANYEVDVALDEMEKTISDADPRIVLNSMIDEMDVTIDVDVEKDEAEATNSEPMYCEHLLLDLEDPPDSSTPPPDSSTDAPDSSADAPDSSADAPDSSTDAPDSSTDPPSRMRMLSLRRTAGAVTVAVAVAVLAIGVSWLALGRTSQGPPVAMRYIEMPTKTTFDRVARPPARLPVKSAPTVASMTFRVEANLPIHGVEVNDRPIGSGRPSPTVDFEVPVRAVESGAIVSVRDQFGRRTRFKLTKDRRRVGVLFPPIPPARRGLALDPY